MSATPEELTRTAPAGDRPGPEASLRYGMLPDAWLTAKRDRRQAQLMELALHPVKSPIFTDLLLSMEHEVHEMTQELVRRAKARHPSSGGTGGRAA
jgi:hypothetical protein